VREPSLRIDMTAGKGREVWKAVEQPRRGHGEQRRGVQREKVDPGLTVLGSDIRAEVRLEKTSGQRPWDANRTRLVDEKRDQGHVGLTREEVDLELARHQRAQRLQRHGPVKEQEIAPALVADRASVNS
jgi:hypothetical protein